MIRWVLAFVLLVLVPATSLAQAVKVTSGEHDGFTRLVLQYGNPTDWQVGRTADGYELRITGGAPVYDLTGVYDIIGRTRLASVWADPVTGALMIGIGCACHAQPFEFRPGIIVIDLKDGPPPKGSSFETAFADADPTDVDPTESVSRPTPRPPTASAARYDWIELARGDKSGEKAAMPEQTAPDTMAQAPLQTDPSLEPLRNALLRQLSRGAAQGVIDMANPTSQTRGPTGTESVQIRLGETPGVLFGRDSEAATGLTATGLDCVADQDLDIASWGSDAPVAAQMADISSGLVGEFDAPEAETVAQAVRFYLFLGFGAEAKHLLDAMPTPQPLGAVWQSMAGILDEEAATSGAFAGMAACDTAAAMWAVLGNPSPKPGEALDRAAVLRSFSALPLHLRRHLGAPLAGRLLELGDAAAAESVRDAIRRAPGEAGARIDMLEAKLDRQAGDAASAADRLEALIDTSGPATPDALADLVDSLVAQRKAMEPSQIVALEGLLHERRGTTDEGRFARATILAHATSGDFERAFLSLPEAPEVEAEVWGLLADIGAESQILTFAVLEAGKKPDVAEEVAAKLAQRLSDLGFANAAADWLSHVPVPDAPLAASILLKQRDARAALRLVAGNDDPSVLPLRVKALQMLGDEAALAETLAGTGQEDARWLALARSSAWEEIAKSGPAPWQEVTRLLGPSAPPGVPGEVATTGGLAEGAALLQTSAETRLAVNELLSAIDSPLTAGP